MRVKQDNTVKFVSVADGSTPRTAAVVAYRTQWECHSVDPQLPADGSSTVRFLLCVQVRVCMRICGLCSCGCV